MSVVKFPGNLALTLGQVQGQVQGLVPVRVPQKGQLEPPAGLVSLELPESLVGLLLPRLLGHWGLLESLVPLAWAPVPALVTVADGFHSLTSKPSSTFHNTTSSIGCAANNTSSSVRRTANSIAHRIKWVWYAETTMRHLPAGLNRLTGGTTGTG
ncbi:hypothetical protein FOPE_08370 [Fonsecaea pedrosoi]|nr:hypothetical protein FOPE_08370 [Fonsecaea pedrosoi]